MFSRLGLDVRDALLLAALSLIVAGVWGLAGWAAGALVAGVMLMALWLAPYLLLVGQRRGGPDGPR